MTIDVLYAETKNGSAMIETVTFASAARGVWVGALAVISGVFVLYTSAYMTVGAGVDVFVTPHEYPVAPVLLLVACAAPLTGYVSRRRARRRGLGLRESLPRMSASMLAIAFPVALALGVLSART